MGEALLTVDELVDLIGSPKPPLACRVVELRDGVEMRSARVIFDGIDAAFQFHVDLETGAVLRMSRTDLGLVMGLDDLRIGSIEEAP